MWTNPFLLNRIIIVLFFNFYNINRIPIKGIQPTC